MQANNKNNPNASISYLQQKQRGIYSEIINPDNSVLFGDSSMLGPNQQFLVQTTKKQTIPKAISIQRSNLNKTSISSDGKKAMGLRAVKPLGIGAIRESLEEELTIDPKVMEPYEPIPGRVPRKVAIDRKKKEYASYNLEQLFAENSIDFNNINKNVEWLPLELFDDTTYDDYSNEEWIKKKSDEDGRQRLITGKGLYKDAAGMYIWKPIIVESYNKTTDKYQCQMRDTQQKIDLHRIYVCLDAENPKKYVQRVVNAFQERVYADSIIRYNFYIDNMPLQDLSELDSEQKKRLEALAKTSKLKDKDTTSLIMEVNQDYERTMNKIIFDRYLETTTELDDQELYPKNLMLPDMDQNKEVRYYGMMPLERQRGVKLVWMYNPSQIQVEEPKDFTETFKDFCFSSLYIKEEVISALQQIRVECNKVLTMEIFNTSFVTVQESNKPKKNVITVLEEFKHIQESSISQILYHLKGGWIQELTKIIKANFKEVGKGWFNMKETSKITYDFGKLKRFLTVVRLMMQDTVLTLVQQKYREFYNFIVSYIPTEVIINSAADIQNKYDRSQPQQPLFIIDLLKTQSDEDFIFSTNPSNFCTMILTTMEKGLEEIAKIPDLEPKILAELYKSLKNETFIKAPRKPTEKPIIPDPNARPLKFPDENLWIWEMFEELKQRLQKAIEPLQRYLKVFDQFKEVLKLNPDDYANKIEMDENPWEIEKIQEEIVKVNEMEKKLKFEIPEFVQVSFFQVQMKEILAYLCEKYFQLQKNLTNLIAKRAKQSTITLFNQFQQIKNKIREVPKNIEQLTEIREYMTATPQELEKIKLEMAKCFDIYKILEGFEHRFSKDDMDRKWIIFGAGKEILELIEGRKKELDKDSVKFAEKMADEQTELKDRIDNLDQTIMNFYSFVDLKQHTEIAATAQNVNKCLTNFQEDARKFNSREALFGLDSTNYDKINAMVKEFTPYSNLWINADKWIEYQKIWMRDDLEMVDAVTAERFVEDAQRILTGVIRFFKERGHEGVLKITQEVKRQIDEFKPKVPLLVALRKKGMMPRHWKQISD